MLYGNLPPNPAQPPIHTEGIDDPLAAFTQIMKAKDERKRREANAATSASNWRRSRSPSVYRRYYNMRNRSRSRSPRGYYNRTSGGSPARKYRRSSRSPPRPGSKKDSPYSRSKHSPPPLKRSPPLYPPSGPHHGYDRKIRSPISRSVDSLRLFLDSLFR